MTSDSRPKRTSVLTAYQSTSLDPLRKWIPQQAGDYYFHVSIGCHKMAHEDIELPCMIEEAQDVIPEGGTGEE